MTFKNRMRVYKVLGLLLLIVVFFAWYGAQQRVVVEQRSCSPGIRVTHKSDKQGGNPSYCVETYANTGGGDTTIGWQTKICSADPDIMERCPEWTKRWPYHEPTF